MEVSKQTEHCPISNFSCGKFLGEKNNSSSQDGKVTLPIRWLVTRVKGMN
jgi:hypothetical protein